MSTHPNVILMARFQPHGLSRKTMDAILGQRYSRDSAPDVKIGQHDYHPLLLESDYDEGLQIAGGEGDLVFYDLVTYGYGEVIAWDDLASRQRVLHAWATEIAAKHACDFNIAVSANYW